MVESQLVVDGTVAGAHVIGRRHLYEILSSGVAAEGGEVVTPYACVPIGDERKLVNIVEIVEPIEATLYPPIVRAACVEIVDPSALVNRRAGGGGNGDFESVVLKGNAAGGRWAGNLKQRCGCRWVPGSAPTEWVRFDAEARYDYLDFVRIGWNGDALWQQRERLRRQQRHAIRVFDRHRAAEQIDRRAVRVKAYG